MTHTTTKNIKFFDYKPEATDVKKEVIHGLSQSPKCLPPKLFYDEAGSKLFEQIVDLEEYYIPTIEKKLLTENMTDINNLLGENITLIEPGSGSCEKAQKILGSHNSVKAYIPIEISGDFLYSSAEKVAENFPDIAIYPICVDYLNDFVLPEELQNYSEKNVLFFPGSSIGNYDKDEVVGVLNKFTELTGKGSGLLIGVDMKKDKEVLERAYDDSKGVTADFNLNLINRIKKEINDQVEVSNFYHQSIYNELEGRIEMYLVSKEDYKFYIDDQLISFKKGEKIHTENSYKYSIEEFKALAEKIGYKLVKYWTDSKNYFTIYYFELS